MRRWNDSSTDNKRRSATRARENPTDPFARFVNQAGVDPDEPRQFVRLTHSGMIAAPYER
jgi:hypothetical protein